MLEGERPRAGCRPLLLDLLGDLALVPNLPRRPTDLAHATVVPGQADPSSADAQATLRRALWERRIFDASEPASLIAKIPPVLIDVYRGGRVV